MNKTQAIRQVSDSLELMRDDQLGSMLSTCNRIMREESDELAVKTAEILKIQVLFELARRTEEEYPACKISTNGTPLYRTIGRDGEYVYVTVPQ